MEFYRFLLKIHKGVALEMTPSFPSSNIADGLLVYPEAMGERHARSSLPWVPSDVSDVGGGQLGVVVSFTARSQVQPCGVRHILDWRQVFEVSLAVVKLAAVFVVGFFSRWLRAEERASDEAMHEPVIPATIHAYHDALVAELSDLCSSNPPPRAKDLPLIRDAIHRKLWHGKESLHAVSI
jgi:hypothetical protein